MRCGMHRALEVDDVIEKMTNSWSLLYHTINGTLDEVFPVMTGPIDEDAKKYVKNTYGLIDEFIINIGGKERDGVTPEEAIQIWDIYKQYLPISANINIKYSNTPPIKATYDYAKNKTFRYEKGMGQSPWDELVVNNFTIKKIHVGPMFYDDFKDDTEIEGFPIMVWKEAESLIQHIQKITNIKK